MESLFMTCFQYPVITGNWLLATALPEPRPLRRRRKVAVFTLEQSNSLFQARLSVMNGEAVRLPFRAAPQRHAGIFAVAAKNVIDHADVPQLRRRLLVGMRDALQHVQTGFARRHSAPHVLHDRMRSCD